MKKRSFSYKALLSNKISQADLEKLATAGMLTDATLARLMHIGRFDGRIAEGMPAHLKVRDLFTEDDLQKIWLETAQDAVSLGSVQ